MPGRALVTPFRKGAAVASFLPLFLFNAPFPLVVIGAGAIGWLIARQRPELLGLKPATTPHHATPAPWRHSLWSAGLGLLAWVAPMVGVLALLGKEHVLWRIGLFFSKLAVVTFGGGYFWYSKTQWIGGQPIQVSFASGNGGNKLYIVPNLDLVVAISSSAYGHGYGQKRSEDILKAVHAASIVGPVPG